MSIEWEEWPSESEWESYFEKYSNWGRWGDDDVLGTLNLITDDKRKRACGLVTTGRQVSCARTIEFGRNLPAEAGGGNAPLHFFSQVAQNAPEAGGYGSHDWIGLPIHGSYITHVDSHAHVVWNRSMYNGQPVSAVTAEFGARKGAIEPFSRGIVTRGILLDIAGLHTVDWLPNGYPIGARDLAAAADKQGVTPEPGDLVMVRTGYGAYRQSDEAKAKRSQSATHTVPGLGVRSLQWFRENDTAVIACDVPTEAFPAPYKWLAPFHAVAMAAMGNWIIDNADFEDLTRACRDLGRWEFLVTIGALRLKNTTGSPINPIVVL
jgi:kynurenine formamidase